MLNILHKDKNDVFGDKGSGKELNNVFREFSLFSDGNYLDFYLKRPLISVDHNSEVVKATDQERKNLDIVSVEYSASKFYGTISIHDHLTGKNLWAMNYVNLLSKKQQKELIKSIYAFVKYESFYKILLNNKAIDSGDLLHQKEDSEIRMKHISHILSSSSGDYLFKFFLMSYVLKSRVILSETFTKKSLSNPFDYRKVAVEDRANLSFFTSVLPLIVIPENMDSLNDLFSKNYTTEIKVYITLLSIIALGEPTDADDSYKVYSMRNDEVYFDLDYIIQSSLAVAPFFSTRDSFNEKLVRISKSYLPNKVVLQNIFCLPASMYKLCFSNMAVEASYSDTVEIGWRKIQNDTEYYKKLHDAFGALDGETNCKEKVKDEMLNNVNPHLVELLDLSLVAHLVGHDMDKFSEVVSFLDDLVGHITELKTIRFHQTDSMGKIFKISGGLNYSEELSISFTYGFILAVAFWSNSNEGLPFTMWINLYDDELFLKK